MFNVQPYSKGNFIATGNTKAVHFMGIGRTMRDWWKYHATQKGWLAAISQIDRPTQGEPVEAHINLNRWTANCECNSCILVDPKDPIFFCLNCMNSFQNVLGQPQPPRPVIFPKDWERIEQILLMRPNPWNRNWETHETIEDLEKENTAHGLEHA